MYKGRSRTERNEEGDSFPERIEAKFRVAVERNQARSKEGSVPRFSKISP